VADHLACPVQDHNRSNLIESWPRSSALARRGKATRPLHTRSTDPVRPTPEERAIAGRRPGRLTALGGPREPSHTALPVDRSPPRKVPMASTRAARSKVAP
jgi:hypothetical protein